LIYFPFYIIYSACFLFSHLNALACITVSIENIPVYSKTMTAAAAAVPAVPVPRPTCKVVLRTYEGTRGPRIHPAGCKVRSYADDDTRKNIRKYNKKDVQKHKIKTKRGAKELELYVRRTANGVTQRKKFIWDTGATAAGCGVVLARQ
jgi:hypothetical protein